VIVSTQAFHQSVQACIISYVFFLSFNYGTGVLHFPGYGTMRHYFVVLCYYSFWLTILSSGNCMPVQHHEARSASFRREESGTQIQGWTSSPKGRGTIDIIWSCVLTISLCSWSILCVNLPAIGEGYWHMVRRKLYLVVICLWGPEVIFMLSFGQYFSARHSVRDFHNLGYPSWTMTHAFFADMGGFVLQTEDMSSFPLDAAQLHYLVKEKLVDFPAITKQAIKDRNKAESLVRIITLIQICWFLLNCIGRVGQSLSITTLELTTVAFVVCTIATSFCWFHKPMDVETPVILAPGITVSGMLARCGGKADQTWDKTPLDFVNRKKEWLWNIGWAWVLAVIKDVFRLDFNPKSRPIERIPNDNFPQPPRRTYPLMAFVHIAYTVIQMAGWNFHFATPEEGLLWRLATSSTLLCFVGIGILDFYSFLSPNIFREFDVDTPKAQKVRSERKCESSKKGSNVLVKKLKNFAARMQNPGSRDPKWKIPMHILVPCILFGGIYTLSRAYMLVEDVMALRSLPSSAYETVDWSSVIPHL
jgi:hypothetical protein